MRSLLTAAASRRRIATQATVCIAVPLIVLTSLGHPTSAVIATQGSFAGFYAFDLPRARRGRVVAVIGAGLVLATVLGTLVAWSAALVILAGGVFALIVAFACVALEVGPPREYFLVFSFLVASGLPADAGAAPARGALVCAGAATAWAIAMASTHRDPERPAREAIARAFDALARLVAAVGRAEAGAAQHEAVLAVRRALVLAGPATALGRRAEAAETLLEATQSLIVTACPPLDAAWVEAVRAPEHAPAALPPNQRLALALATARAELTSAATVGLPERRRWIETLRDGAQPHALAPVVAVRLGVAVAAGLALGAAVGISHSYWIALSAAAVLQSSNARVTVRRAAHRTGGTLVGLFGAAAFLAPSPPIGVLVVAVVALQFVTESVIVASYGLAVVFITSLALVLLEIAHPAFGAGLLAARAMDTLLGCALGLAVGTGLWPRRSALRLASAQAAALRAAGDALAAGLRHAPRHELRAQRRRAHVSALNLRAVQRDAIADVLRSSPVADERWPLTHAIEHFVSVATSLPPRRPAPELATVIQRTTDALAQAAEGQATGVQTPHLPGLPATERALAQVRHALVVAGPA